MLNDRPRFVSVPSRGRRESRLRSIKDEIRERSNHTCDYCGAEAHEVEHIAPVSDQGINDPRNLILACSTCNRTKGAQPLTDFLANTDNVVSAVSDLPIYGDLILETPELPEPYRKVRRDSIIEFRRSGRFSGANAFKNLEKKFRRKLWQTDYGYWLCLKYPESIPGLSGRPGQRRVAIPLITSLVPDTSMPIFSMLDILTKSAATRHLIDDILIYAKHDGEDLQDAIEIAFTEARNATAEKLAQNIDGTRFESFSDEDLSIPAGNDDIPVRKRQLAIIDIHDFRNAGGHLRGSLDGFEIRVPNGETGSDVPVIVTEVTKEYAEAEPLSHLSSPSIEFDEGRAKRVIRERPV